MSALMTLSKLKKLATTVPAPISRSERWGNSLVGCNTASCRKKTPSHAAA